MITQLFTSTIMIISLVMLNSLVILSRPLKINVPIEDFFDQWIVEYGRVYKTPQEKEYRFSIFKENIEYIETFNNVTDHTYTLGINEFVDLTNDEFQATYTGNEVPDLNDRYDNSFLYENMTNIPSSIDWRAAGAVTEVKNQRACGGCWAFAAVGAVEGITKIVKHNLISLSEQEVIDCDKNPRDHGCKSGIVLSAFDFIIHNGGLVSEAKYPYKGITQNCNKALTSPSMASITGYQKVPYKDEVALQKAVANQPVTVGVEASADWRFYKNGVFTGRCGTNVHHAVLVIGYGTTGDGKKYWLAKNSWGPKWGENGYIRILRDVEQKEGLCGIAMYASYPTI